MNLLASINAHTVDEGYADVAGRRPGGGTSNGRIGLPGAVALVLFAGLLVVAGVQSSRSASTEERDRRALIGQVDERRKDVDRDQAELARLRASTSRGQDALVTRRALLARRASQLDVLRRSSGTRVVHGPGVEVLLDDAVGATEGRQKVFDVDLQHLVNGLWAAGAEAISINGQRLTALSAIRSAGGAITVNFVKLGPPFSVLAIGNPEELPDRFARSSGGSELFGLHDQFGLRLKITRRDSLTLPAAPLPVFRWVDRP